MAVVVPNNVVIAFDGAHASVPSGYSRYTALDDRFPLGASAGNAGGTTGGATTHTHTTVGHTHTANHVHSISGGTANGSVTVVAGATALPSSTHTHSAANSASASVTSDSTTVSLNTASNNPPYYTVVWIQSNGTVGVPNNCIGWQVPTTAPSGFSLNNAGKFLKGATTGADAGGTGGSSDSHTHTESGHGHTITGTHTHGAANSGLPVGNVSTNPGTGTGMNRRNHTHSLSLSASSMTSLVTTVSTIQNADGQPPFNKLMAIKNTSGGTLDVPDLFVALWFGSLATIPSGWSLMDGTGATSDMRDKFVKNSTTTSDTGTGGANQHAHTADAHTHKVPEHSSGHTVTAGNGVESNPDISSLDVTAGLGTHSHTWTITAWTTSPDTRPDSGSTTITVNNNTSADNYPLYLTTNFIQKDATSVTTTPLRTLMGVGV